MASIDDIAQGGGSAPHVIATSPPPPPPAPPAPPEWVPAPHPWVAPPGPPAGSVGRPTAPPLADAPGGPPPWNGWTTPPPVPPPPYTTSRDARRPKRFVLAVVAALAIGGLLGAGIGKVIHIHGARPTLSTSSPAVTPTLPSGPSGPSAGTSGGSTRTPDAATIAANVDPSIVDVNTVSAYEGGSGAGTGMILTSTGDILTNNHVVDGATSVTVTLVSTGRAYKAEVVGTSPTQDIAVIRIKASGLRPISIGDSSAVAKLDSVVAIGNAGGAGGTPAVVTGRVLSVNQTITASDTGGQNPETLHGLIRTSAPIQPGDSGGALVDASGKVIGINTAASASRQFSGGTSEGFAIPIAKAMSVARQIESGKETAMIHIGLPGFLGVAIEPASATQAVAGAVVQGVEPGSPAADAGLEALDTITSLDGHPVTTPDSLSALTRAHQKGDKVSVAWTDQDGAQHTMTVTLIAGPAD